MLFSPLVLRDVELRNRIGASPMCQYSSVGGFANDWHFVHLGGLAVGGAGLVFTEATAVTPEGRISPQDLGIWRDAHVTELLRITAFIRAQGAVAGMQLAHAGRKASTVRPWEGHGAVAAVDGAWEVVAPSAAPFSADYPQPRALAIPEILQLTEAFAQAARRALAAGFQVLELHAAHGYLMHEFLSPLANQRTDEFGGSFDNRIRFPLAVVDAVRHVWPERLPLFVRISATDWADGGWTIEESIAFAKHLKAHGVDVVDCSSGGMVHGLRPPVAPAYHAPFAERLRREGGIATAVVGLITGARQAEAIVQSGQADIVLLARELLRQPRWPLLAARELGVTVPWPVQYERAKS